jgi:hypothetical protein
MLCNNSLRYWASSTVIVILNSLFKSSGIYASLNQSSFFHFFLCNLTFSIINMQQCPNIIIKCHLSYIHMMAFCPNTMLSCYYKHYNFIDSVLLEHYCRWVCKSLRFLSVKKSIGYEQSTIEIEIHLSVLVYMLFSNYYGFF